MVRKFFSLRKKLKTVSVLCIIGSIQKTSYIDLHVSLFCVSTCLILIGDDTLFFSCYCLMKMGRLSVDTFCHLFINSIGHMIQMWPVSPYYYVFFPLLQRAHILKMNDRIQFTVRFSFEQIKKKNQLFIYADLICDFGPVLHSAQPNDPLSHPELRSLLMECCARGFPGQPQHQRLVSVSCVLLVLGLRIRTVVF